MCTLTVIPGANSHYRLAFNRDESPTRAKGLPPQVRHFGTHCAIMPIDPVSGGTWLAVNDAGLSLALLNVNLADRDRAAPKPPRSRGEIIPAFLTTDSPAAALVAAEHLLDYRDFAPFRLILIGNGVAADVRWDGREPMGTSRPVVSPQMFTSSGLGDHVVEGVRGELFEELFAGLPESWEASQDAFHRHRWPGREHISVNMTRATARTVSFSVIEVGPASAVFTYQDASPDTTAECVKVQLPLLAVGP
ncbi:MAG: NRDE family protein [Planctomycetes bacterium]|nr:NRDE family protein [Planctomycetota bacterium]